MQPVAAPEPLTRQEIMSRMIRSTKLKLIARIKALVASGRVDETYAAVNLIDQVDSSVTVVAGVVRPGPLATVLASLERLPEGSAVSLSDGQLNALRDLADSQVKSSTPG